MTKLIPGVLKLFSSVKYGKNKRNIPIILFKPYNGLLPNYFVHTKEKSQKNLYVLISHHSENEGKYPRGILQRIIGPIGDYKAEMNYILAIYECSIYNEGFKPWQSIIKKNNHIRNKISNDLQNIDELQNVKCDYKVMSIDPRGCKDIDDAFHFIKKKDTFEIGIHIADLAFYIDNSLESIVKKRCYTIYNEMGVENPMLPEIYSENICSLVKDQNRRAKSLIFTYDLKGNIISRKLKNSIIKNIRNFTYEKVDHLIETGIGKNLAEINCLLCIKFYQRLVKETLDSHRFIEYIMVLTNKTIGEIIIEKYGKACIIRTHDEPIENIDGFNKLDKADQRYIKMRNFKKAIYEIDKDKYHYALGIKNYVHFTSPIRRYNDIIIHKIVDGIINKSNQDLELIEDDINMINNIEKRIRKADRMRDKCKLIYQLEKEHLEEEIILDGLVIKIKEKYLLIYFSKYDIEERLPYDKAEEEIKLYDNIKCRLIPFFGNQKFHNKIKIEII